jgi:predicted transcriptional regulator
LKGRLNLKSLRALTEIMQQLKLNVVLPTRGEMRILNVLWELGKGTVEMITQHPSFSSPPNYKTTQTLLRIMEEKHLVTHYKDSRIFVFVPCVTRDQVTRLSVQTLLDQSFSGSVREMMVGVIETGAIGDSELEELEGVIRKYRAERNKSKNGKT